MLSEFYFHHKSKILITFSIGDIYKLSTQNFILNLAFEVLMKFRIKIFIQSSEM
jgi:hypothetical protein